MLQMRTHSVLFGEHAKLFSFTKEIKVTKLEEPGIRLKFGVSLYIQGLLNTVPVLSIHFGHIHWIL